MGAQILPTWQKYYLPQLKIHGYSKGKNAEHRLHAEETGFGHGAARISRGVALEFARKGTPSPCIVDGVQ
jgi:hypothetical protein